MRHALTRVRAPLLAVAVALVLADSAIVTLALPDIAVHLDASVTQVAWVLIGFNLVLGLTAVPTAALLDRGSLRTLTAVGIAVFALASAGCAAAGTVELLIAARCVQALGGALALVGGLELLVGDLGGRRGTATWVVAGVVGTALGPVAGGLLTQAFSWQAIFVVQLPFAVLAVPAALSLPRSVAAPPSPEPPDTGGRHGPAVRPNLTLALLSAALTAALFLLVLLLVEGWQHSPGAAALTVSVVPVAALAAGPLVRLLPAPHELVVAVGCLLVAGGLAALGLLPSSDLGWTIAPQVLVGLGLGLTVDRLTERALHQRLPRVRHAGWTMAARHLGVVVGLAVLTPVFVADLQQAQTPAQEAITALVLDAPLAPQEKISLARGLGDALVGQRGRVPDLHPVFAGLAVADDERPAAQQLETALDDQLERAATRAFRDSFLLGAGLALLAMLSALLPGRRRPT